MTKKDSIAKLNKDKSLLVLWLAWIWVIGISYKLYGFFDYEYYQFMFQQLPEQTIRIRYCFSIIFRCVSLIVAIGLIAHVDFYRKMTLLLASVNLAILYWKHPFYVFHNIAIFSEKGFVGDNPIVTGNEVLAYPLYPWIALVSLSAIDVLLCGCLLYFLTRKNIKAKFK